MRSATPEHWQVFGASLRQLRETRGWTLRQFAKAVGIASSYQSNIEHGLTAPPSPAVLTRMAEALDMPVNPLFTRAGKLPPHLWRALWTHPALPPILSTLPGLTLDDAQAFCTSIAASSPDVPA